MDEHRHTSDLKPDVDFGKKTTKVNMWMVVGVVVFTLIAVFITWRIAMNPPASTEEMQERSGTLVP